MDPNYLQGTTALLQGKLSLQEHMVLCTLFVVRQVSIAVSGRYVDQTMCECMSSAGQSSTHLLGRVCKFIKWATKLAMFAT